jgi:hypothetical protein
MWVVVVAPFTHCVSRFCPSQVFVRPPPVRVFPLLSFV